MSSFSNGGQATLVQIYVRATLTILLPSKSAGYHSARHDLEKDRSIQHDNTNTCNVHDAFSLHSDGKHPCMYILCPGSRSEYALAGDVVNLAARLAASAEKGKNGVLCDQTTLQSLVGEVRLRTRFGKPSAHII